MQINFIAVLAAALIPMIMGFIWYNPKVVGNAWMRESGMNEEKMKGANMAVIFSLSFVFSFMLALALQMLVIHQFHIGSLFAHHQQDLANPSTETGALYQTIMTRYGSEFRTFKHGAFHGILSSVFLVLPIIGINAMFERKSWKYVWIHLGYWAISFALMGGVLCAWK
ncbi:DUF1761 domain-containing protein [Rurimicrobium arvi]|uniref:DUF1761 domain-containing protein n=1 Tax=Rurimicrobium arvi TaxID=2049916 RepID=A0ABP8MWL9_9BACT